MWDAIQVLGAWALVAVAVERITEVLIHGEIFFGLRSTIAIWHTNNVDSKCLWVLSKVSSCAWCCSVWISFICTFTLPGGFFHIDANNNFIIKWFALVGASNLWHAIFRLIFRGRVHTSEVTTIQKYEYYQPELMEEEIEDV